jgi:hypothetical protein
MAQVTEILGQLPQEAPDPLIELWKKLMAEGQGNQVAQQQGANIRPSEATPQQAPALNQALMQGMGQGLGPTQYGGGNDTGLTYSGGVAGYAGGPRASDNTPVRTASYSDQAGQQRMVDTERQRNMPGPGGMTMGDLMDKIAPAMKLGPAQYSAINAMGIPGIRVTDPNEARLASAGLANQREARMAAQAARIPQVDRRELDNLRNAHALTGRLQAAHKDLFNGSSTSLSDALKSAIASSGKANTIQQAFINTDALTGEKERAYAAEYNNIVSNLYNMTQERQLSEQDAIRNLRSFNPAVSPAQFQVNIDARRKSFENKFLGKVKGLATQGYNPQGYESVTEQQKEEPVPTAPPAAASGGGRVTVIAPDGKKFTLPPEQLAEAEKQGYKRAQ